MPKLDTTINIPTLISVGFAAGGLIYGFAQRDSQIAALQADSHENKIQHQQLTETMQTAIEGQHRLALAVEQITVRLDERTKRGGVN